MNRKCERCDTDCVRGNRYCSRCRKEVLAELQVAGYLAYAPRTLAPQWRSDDYKEITRETKFGIDR